MYVLHCYVNIVPLELYTPMFVCIYVIHDIFRVLTFFLRHKGEVTHVPKKTRK